MPARIATLRLENAGSVRQWQATATVQDTAAGSSVDVAFLQTVSGATPPLAANTVTLEFRTVDAGAAIRTITNPADGNHTFWFTANGLEAGAARCGTVEIVIRATRTDVPAYDYETDGSPNTGGQATLLDRGWIRGTTTLVEDISNTSLGGAPNPPAVYDESLFVRTTAGHVSYVARALSVALSHGGVTGTTNSTTAAQRDVTFSNVADDRFAAGVTTVGLTVTVPNTTLTGLPDFTFTSTTDDTLDVDPRLTASHLFQVDVASFATPPTGNNRASKEWLNSESVFLATRLVNARGAGVDGLTVTQSHTPVSPGTAVTGSSTTATRGGEAGWTDLLANPSAKPGGTWNKTMDVTAPGDADSDPHVIGGSDAHTMLAPNPAFRVVVSAGISETTGGQPADHWHPGDDLLVGAALVDFSALDLLTPSAAAGKTPMATLVRFTAGGQVEALADDFVTWTPLPIDGSGSVNSFVLVAASGSIPGADPRVFIRVIPGTSTALWTSPTRDLVVTATLYDAGGTPYSNSSIVGAVATSANGHAGFRFDPTGLFK